MDTKIIQAAEKYRDDMTKFLRDMVAIPSESCQEKDVILRIKQEMEKSALTKSASTRWATFWVVSDTANTLSPWTLILTRSVSPTRNCGPAIRTKANWKTASSTAAALPTRKAVWLPWFRRQNHQRPGIGRRLYAVGYRYGSGRRLRRTLLGRDHERKSSGSRA